MRNIDEQVMAHQPLETDCCPNCQIQTNQTVKQAETDRRDRQRQLIRLFSGVLLFALSFVFSNLPGFMMTLLVAAYLILGYDVVIRAARGLYQKKILDEHFLMSLATIGAFVIGEYPEAVAVMLFYQVGEYFQSKAVAKSRRSISQLQQIRPDKARLLEGLVVVDTTPDQINTGNRLLILPGDRVPVDCEIIEGQSDFNTAALTGESQPRDADVGDELMAGFINGSGRIVARALRPASESAVSRVIALTEHAAAGKAPAERFITRFASVYTPAVVLLALFVAVVPPIVFQDPFTDWIYRAFILLVISCPCALVISVPLSYFAGLGAASRQGLLVKGGQYLEKMAAADTLVFDKTGTLTEGRFAIEHMTVATDSRLSEKEIMRIAAAAEAHATHPVALSICRRWEEMSGEKPDNNLISALRDLPGQGLTANIQGVPLLIGSARLMQTFRIQGFDGVGNDTVKVSSLAKQGAVAQHTAVNREQTDINQTINQTSNQTINQTRNQTKIQDSNQTRDQASNQIGKGQSAHEQSTRALTQIHIAYDGRYVASLYLKDQLKPDLGKTINRFRKLGIKKMILLSGDRQAIVEETAGQLKLDQAFADMLPEQKIDQLEKIIMTSNRPVVYLGDGINDAPALARADVGIAMGSGSDTAIESADAVLMSGEIKRLPAALRLARKTARIVRQNVAIALGLKLLIMLLALAGLSSIWQAILADVGVSLLAILNSLRLMRKRSENI